KIQDKRRGGYVFIKGIDEQKKEEYIEGSLIELKKQIIKLKDTHSVEDICILVRTNKELNAVSEFLINETNYEVVSSGALTLASSDMLQIIMAVIRHLNTPSDLYIKTIAYLLFKSNNKKDDLHTLFKTDTDTYLPDNFTETLENLKQKSGIEIIKELVSEFKLMDFFPNQEVFISRFYNELKHLIFDKGSNLETIINWWETKGESINIELSEATSSGIKVMTIHKSKGLQFKHVILPFAQWAPKNQQDTQWLPGSAFTFEETNDGLFPVNLNKSHLICNELSKYYEEEKFASLIDLINVLYVATTRAEDGLHIFYHKSPHSKNDISNYIKEILINENELKDILKSIEDDCYELGEIPNPDMTKKSELEKIQITFSAKNNIAVKSTIQSIYKTDSYENYAIAKGSFWHKIFERIENQSDIRSAVIKQHDLGNISAPQAEILIQQIKEWLKQPEISKWFSGDIKVINEADIIIPHKSSKRPDRIVIHNNGTDIIDYKFGQKQSDQYIQQVNEYCSLFKEMGYNNVKGYLWYPLLNKIVPTNN
ncbi:MAG: hypothetical protein C0599_10815, partial [Salinivirgaceae bacterium]